MYELCIVVAMCLAYWYFRGRHLYVGTGVVLSRRRYGADEGKWYVRTRLLNGPAGKAGMRIGDIVLRVNGLALETVDPDKVGDYLKKRWREEVRFTIMRSGKEMEFCLKCELIQGPIPVYSHEMVMDNPDLTQGMVICRRTGVWIPTQRLSDGALQRIFG